MVLYQCDPFSLYLFAWCPLELSLSRSAVLGKKLSNISNTKWYRPGCACAISFTKLQDKWCTYTIFFTFIIWVFTLIWLKPENIAQTSGTTPKLEAKLNGLSVNKLFALMTNEISNHKFIRAEMFHMEQLSCIYHWVCLWEVAIWKTCPLDPNPGIVSNMQIRKYGFRAIMSHGSTNNYIIRICSSFPEHVPFRIGHETTRKNNSQKTFEFRSRPSQIYTLLWSV